jgi:hypothetical protein
MSALRPLIPRKRRLADISGRLKSANCRHPRQAPWRVPRPLCKFGIEKDVERSDLAIANNDDIQSGVGWSLAFRA